MKKLLMNCPNCGAPLSSDGYCSYCDTKVRYANELEYNTLSSSGMMKDILPTEILFKFKSDDGTMVIIPFIGKPQNIEIAYDQVDCIGYGGTRLTSYRSSPTVRFEFEGTIDGKILR